MTSTLVEEVVFMQALSSAKKAAEKPLLSKRKLEGSEQSGFLRQCAGERKVHLPPWDIWLLPVDTALSHRAKERNIMQMCVHDHLLLHNVAFTPPLHWQVCSHSSSCTFTISSFTKGLARGGRRVSVGNVLAWVPTLTKLFSVTQPQTKQIPYQYLLV